ncbi:UBN2 domain-containing protein [Tanacetum coccineum]
MLEKGGYDTWKSRRLLHVEGNEHGNMLLDSILYDTFEYKVSTFPANEAMGVAAVTRMQEYKDLSPKEKIRKNCDIKAANIILHGIPNDIYTLLNHKKIAYDIWYMVKELTKVIELTKQEKESKLADEFDRFTSEKGETIHSYYLWFAKLMNDINVIRLKMKPLQVNTKFVNNLQPEWSRFVIGAKQAKELHKVSFIQLVMVMLEGAEELEIQGVVRTTRDLNAIPPKVIKCYNCKGEGHYTKQCTLKKRVKDFEWFKEKMLIAPQQEAGIKIAEE